MRIFQKQQHRVSPNGYEPNVSVVIAAYNEEIGIAKTIRSILDNKYENLEIIVVNDGSADNTKGIVEKIIRNDKTNKIQLFNHSKNLGKHAAINNAVSHSKGEIIVAIDADTYIYPTTIKSIVSNFKDKNLAAAAGNIIIGNTDTLAGLLQFFEFTFGIQTLFTKSKIDEVYYLSGILSAYRKDAFKKVKGFDGYSKTEDFDFTLKLKQAGYKIINDYNAIAITEGASSLITLFKQRIRWTHGGLLSLIHHKNMYKNPRIKEKLSSLLEFPLVALAFVDLVVYPFLNILFYSMYIFYGCRLILLFSYFVTTIAGACTVDWKRNRHLLKYIPLLPIFHFAMSILTFSVFIISIIKILRKESPSWQNWQRNGLN